MGLGTGTAAVVAMRRPGTAITAIDRYILMAHSMGHITVILAFMGAGVAGLGAGGGVGRDLRAPCGETVVSGNAARALEAVCSEHPLRRSRGVPLLPGRGLAELYANRTRVAYRGRARERWDEDVVDVAATQQKASVCDRRGFLVISTLPASPTIVPDPKFAT
jgi:hypothetical protein